MRSFRDGTYNVLVSTSVAEEGLDIGECELVVFYDAVPSAIRLIQRKGRTGRRKEGKVIMLIAEGTRDEAYMWASRKQAQKMKRLVRKLEKPVKASDKIKKGEKQMGILDFLQEAERISDKKEEKKEDSREINQVENELDVISIENKEGGIKVICDSRERNSIVIKELMNKNVELGFERLDIGDYICSDQVVVERKTNEDFIKSILDKRLFSQMKILVESCSKPVLIIEGEMNLFGSSLHPHALAGAITSIATDFKIPIIYTKNQRETAELLFAMARREQEERKRKISIGKRKGIGLKIQLEEAVSSLPHVDYKIAKRLLNHFGSIREIISANLEDLFEIKGIGEKIANDIIDFVYANYSEIEDGEQYNSIQEKLDFLKKEDKGRKSRGTMNVKSQ